MVHVETGRRQVVWAGIQGGVYHYYEESTENAGENRGELLAHDRVVREWLRPDVKAGAPAAPIAPFVLPKGLKLEQAGLVAFAQSGAGEVLQAVSCDFKP